MSLNVNLKLMGIIKNNMKIRHLIFKLKRRIFGEYYWVGPETEIGICDECAIPNVHHTLQKKLPVRRLIPEDNIYLCINHWESARNNPGCLPLEPFLRSIKSSLHKK